MYTFKYAFGNNKSRALDLSAKISRQINPSVSPNKIPSFEFGINYTDAGDEPFNMIVTGCQGAGTTKQAKLALVMNEVISAHEKGKVAGMLLGDNFYDSGVDQAHDLLFQRLFSGYYSQTHDWFAVLGNHDWNFQHPIKSWLGSSQSHVNKAMAQVEHTYLTQNSHKLDRWLMPHRYYVIESNWANIIVLDSNTFCFDPEQQQWFKNTLTTAKQKTPERNNVLAMHHPLVSVGKRYPGSEVYDIEQYLLPEYRYTGNRAISMNQLLLNKLDTMMSELNKTKNNYSIDLILCAHDHFLADSYIDALACRQLTIGGGGGDLQEVKVRKATDFSAEQHGFVKIIFDKDGISYKFYNQTLELLHKNNIASVQPRLRECC